MRNIYLLLPILFFVFSCTETLEDNGKRVEGVATEDVNNNAAIIRNPITAETEEIDTTTLAKFSFVEERYHFGKLDQGGKVKHTYAFSNTGYVPLIISDVRSTCGCTVAEWPREAIPPGAKGEITVNFDSKNKTGKQSKPITITANTIPAKTTIYLDGFVVE